MAKQQNSQNITLLGGVLRLLCIAVIIYAGAYAADRYFPKIGEKFASSARAYLQKSYSGTECREWHQDWFTDILPRAAVTEITTD